MCAEIRIYKLRWISAFVDLKCNLAILNNISRSEFYNKLVSSHHFHAHIRIYITAKKLMFWEAILANYISKWTGSKIIFVFKVALWATHNNSTSKLSQISGWGAFVLNDIISVCWKKYSRFSLIIVDTHSRSIPENYR